MPRQVATRTMRTQITLQAPSVITNSLGEQIETWADEATVFAEATPARARELVAGGKEQLPVDVVFRIRYREVPANRRIRWRGDLYEIEGEPIDVDGRRLTIELMTIKGVRDGR
jgi:SPP1 family predicted phage head-tail adaptor